MLSADEVTQLWKRTRFNIPRMIRIRTMLFDEVFSPCLGLSLIGNDLLHLQLHVAAALRVSLTVVEPSLVVLANRPLTRELAYRTAWRLAGNIDKLKKGLPVFEWVGQTDYEIVPVQVIASEPRTTKRGRFMTVYRAAVLIGSPAAMTLTMWWSRSFSAMLARRVGYTSSFKEFPFRHPSELVNMRILALLDPTRLSDGTPQVTDVRCTGALRKWNRVIIGKRARRLGLVPWRCPRGFNILCYTCPVGYMDCEAATHRVTDPTKLAAMSG